MLLSCVKYLVSPMFISIIMLLWHRLSKPMIDMYTPLTSYTCMKYSSDCLNIWTVGTNNKYDVVGSWYKIKVDRQSNWIELAMTGVSGNYNYQNDWTHWTHTHTEWSSLWQREKLKASDTEEDRLHRRVWCNKMWNMYWKVLACLPDRCTENARRSIS